MPGGHHGEGGRHGRRGPGGPGVGRGAGGGRGRAAQPRRIRRFMEPALLLSLHGSPTHGYGLAESLEAMGLEAYPADLSAIYRILYDLEAQGMLVSRQDSERTAGPPRRVYELTEEGRVYLREWVEDLQATDRVLHRFLEAYDREMQVGDDQTNGQR